MSDILLGMLGGGWMIGGRRGYWEESYWDESAANLRSGTKRSVGWAARSSV